MFTECGYNTTLATFDFQQGGGRMCGLWEGGMWGCGGGGPLDGNVIGRVHCTDECIKNSTKLDPLLCDARHSLYCTWFKLQAL